MSSPATRSRAWTLAIALAVAGAALAWLVLGAREAPQPAASTPAQARAEAAEASRPSTPTDPAPPAAEPPVAAGPGATDITAPAPPTTALDPSSGRVPARSVPAERPAAPAPAEAVRQQIRLTSPLDRDLLAEVERLTKGATPDELRELLALARNGTPQAELRQFIDTHLTGDLAVRVAASRWLAAREGEAASQPDSGAGSPGAAPAAHGSSSVPPALGEGGSRRRVTAPAKVH